VLNAGLLISMLMATTSLIILLPYFAYVMSFLSPENIILKIQNSGLNYVKKSGELPLSQAKKGLLNAIDELQDIARRSVELSDRAVEMASINALLNIILSYQDLIKKANAQTQDWSKVEEVITNDPDFISLSAAALRRINDNQTWVEVKILRQYLDLVSDSNPSARDTSYLIAINTRRIAIESLETRNDLELVDLCIRCFNSYLRATINNNDPRTGYYVMNQYRILAEELLIKGQNAPVRDIVLHLKFYGILGFQKEQPFLLEVAAEDTALLASRCIRTNPVILDELLTQLLQLDQEIKEEYQEDSLLGVRRAQVKLAAALLQAGDANRATLIIDDLKDEVPERLIRLIKNLKSEDRDEYWEFTDRGVNFAYLDPELRNYLDQIRDQIIA